jgi:hexosaminidase
MIMNLNLVPAPQRVETSPGCFTLNDATAVLHTDDDAAVRAAAEALACALRPATGFALPVRRGKAGSANSIVLQRVPADAQLGEEGYRLTVTPDTVNIAAPAPAGLQYGAQTLLQLLPHYIVSKWRVPRMDPLPADVVLPAGWRAPAWEIPCVAIEDWPRFAWRGLMMDCSRHFMPVATLEWCMDKMLQLKMNRLHLHLSDNHGWRIEVPGWPRLTEIGSRIEPEPRRHGFYTNDDIRRLVAYGAARNIVLIPEIDIPGHIYAAVKSYPELCCTGQPRRNDLSHWHQLDILCAGNDRVCAFLDDAFGALMALFPGPYIHVGGDEAPKDRWRACLKCQERIRRERLANEAELQAWLISRISETIRRAGRRVIAWDDVLDGHPQSDVIIHWWNRSRGMRPPLEAFQRGHDVICSRGDWNYYRPWFGEAQLESFYRDAEYLPPESRGFGEEGPNLPHQDPAEWRHILGAQGCMWTESTPPETVPYRIFPAMLANAELQWHYTPQLQRDVAAFTRRALKMYNHIEGFSPLQWGS